MSIIPLGRLIRQNFNELRNKKGSIFIEASLVLPLTCIILITMITTAMSFYGDLAEQAKNHKEELAEKSYLLQMALIRNYEKDNR